MKITYTAPNRSHHYPYAEALHRAGHLHAFISGFSRLSPRSPLPSLGKKLKRHDFFQTLYLASLKFNMPAPIVSTFNHLTNKRLDHASYPWAKESDVFIFYRTQGYHTMKRLHREGARTLCVMEALNSHIDFAQNLQMEEFNQLGLNHKYLQASDYALRLKTYEETDLILCPSEYVRNSFITKGFSPNKLIKVNYGFPPVEIKTTEKEQSKDGTFRMLYVGQLHYRKGLRYAIEAFRKLNHPKKEFIIVGGKTGVTGLEKVSIPEGVIFTGVLKGEDLKEQYRRASVFVLPSVDEGLALVQFEALTFGLPLLITTNTGGADIIHNEKEGFICPIANSTFLGQRLQQLADDTHLLNTMSSSALQTARNFGSWDDAAGHLVSELTHILNARKINDKNLQLLPK